MARFLPSVRLTVCLQISKLFIGYLGGLSRNYYSERGEVSHQEDVPNVAWSNIKPAVNFYHDYIFGVSIEKFHDVSSQPKTSIFLLKISPTL